MGMPANALAADNDAGHELYHAVRIQPALGRRVPNGYQRNRATSKIRSNINTSATHATRQPCTALSFPLLSKSSWSSLSLSSCTHCARGSAFNLLLRLERLEVPEVDELEARHPRVVQRLYRPATGACRSTRKSKQRKGQSKIRGKHTPLTQGASTS